MQPHTTTHNHPQPSTTTHNGKQGIFLGLKMPNMSYLYSEILKTLNLKLACPN